MYKKKILDNGLRVIAGSSLKMQSVALGIWIKVGGRYEEAPHKGISHFLEHLIFKGSKSYSCRQIKESIEGVGGSLNGFTSEEFTCYMVKMPKRYLDLAVDVLSDMVINPLLPEEEITKERTVILEEIKMYKDLPQHYVYDLLDGLLWPSQPLGLSIIGKEESVRAIQRKDLLQHKNNYYHPSNIVFSAVGSLNEGRLISKIQSKFKNLSRKINKEFLKVKEEQRIPQLEIFSKDTEQTHLALGFHGFKRDHPFRFALDLLHVVLGANMSSRLFDELREKRGLAYEIGTGIKRFHDTGAFIVHAGIDNRKVRESVILILKELNKTKKELVSEGELKRAKEFYSGQLTLMLEDTLDEMLWIGESASALDRAYSLDEIIKQIKKVKLGDLLEVSRRIFKEENINLALIGPLDDQRDKIKNALVLS